MIKSLLAVSILAAAGAANAATVATFSVDISGSFTSPPTAAGTIQSTSPGTAVLDVTNGVATLTMDTNVATNTTLFATPPAHTTTEDSHSVFTGTLTGNALNWTTATNTLSNCQAQPASDNTAVYICSQLPKGAQPTTMDQNPMVFDLSSIGAVSHFTANSADPGNESFYTLTATSVPSVPVPAAAWLFGSGLLGLAGTARRRRQTA